MKIFKKYFKRIVVGVLACVTLVTTCITPIYAAPGENNSNDYRKTMLQIKKGQKISDVDTSTLTMDELRVIALYLSNLYVPFSTAFDDGDELGIKEKMAETLSKNCGFDEDMANVLVNAVFEASLSSAKPLYVDMSEEQYKTVVNGITNIDINVLGHHISAGTSGSNPLESVHSSLKKVPNAENALSGNTYRFTYGMFLSAVSNKVKLKSYWSDSTSPSYDEAKVAFGTGDHTMNSYGLYNAALNYENGVGSGFLTTDTDTASSLPARDLVKVIAPLTQLYVDWVGNIIMDTGTSRVVILPACMNPYTFKVIEGDPGNRINLVSLVGFAEYNASHIVPIEEEGKELDGDKIRYNVLVYGGFDDPLDQSKAINKAGGSLFNLNVYRSSYGDDERDIFDQGGWGSRGNAEDYTELVKNYYKVDGWQNGLRFPSWESRLDTTDGVNITEVRTDPNTGTVYSYEAVNDSTYMQTDASSMAFSDYVFLDNIQLEEMDSDISKYFEVRDIVKDKQDTSYQVSFSDLSDYGSIANIASSDGGNAMDKIYYTYLFAYSNWQGKLETFDPEKTLVDMMFNGDAFPTDFNNEIDWGEIAEEAGNDQLQSEIMSMVYYILHPAEGMRYFSAWAKNKISAFLLGWHEDMVGATSSNASTGLTRYIGFSGYTTIPALEDMSWTNWLLENYNSIIVYLIIIIAVILCCYVIVGSLTTQRALVGMFMFAILAFLPPVAINAAVGIVNQACDAIYGTKFTYWALVQHQSYLSDLYAGLNGTEDDYDEFVLKYQYQNQNDEGFNPDAEEQTENGYASVKLKWMSPKKDNYLASYAQELNKLLNNEGGNNGGSTSEGGSESEGGESDGEESEGENTEEGTEEEDTEEESTGYNESNTSNGNVLTNLGMGMMHQTVSGEEFLESPDALYLYRNYMDITSYSIKSYNLYSTFYGGTGADGNNVVNFTTGEYMNQVGAKWSGNRNNKYMTYDSGVPLQSTIFANYEASTQYNADKELKEVSSLSAIRKGFLYNTLGDASKTRTDYYSPHTMATNYLLNFTSAYDDIYVAKEKLQNDIHNGTVQIDRNRLYTYGLPQAYFNFTQTNLSATDNEKYDPVLLDYFYYSMYSESPYYFFSYNILDQMTAMPDSQYKYSLSKSGGTNENIAGTTGNFKDLLLGNNLEYFFNYSENSGDGYGELRDFMNMHDLFYYVIPLMDNGDDLIEMFDDAYGMTLYEDIKVRFTADGYVVIVKDGKEQVISDVVAPSGSQLTDEYLDPTLKGHTMTYKELVADWTEEEVYKFWHNYNVTTIFNAYCTWVDTMYDCGYAKPETIHIGGTKKVVENPLDPTSYYMSPDYARNADGSIKRNDMGEPQINGWIYDGRPMIFSRSEMEYYGLEWSDLTKVEQKIINVQDAVYEKALDLMNYVSFDDDVLISAYGMIQLFEFNKEFSQNSFIGESFVMYPQSYELKAFTYDAYLRLIIANTTGDDLQAESGKSLYERTMENSSITFGILLIILDIICVYLIPAFKVFFLVAIFFMSIMLIVASAVKIELNILQVTWKSLIFPLLSFSAVSIGLAFVVSLFMSNGAKGVTGELTPTIQLGDPTMVVAVMIVINAIALYLYFKICKQAAKDFIKYTKAIMSNIGGTVVGAFKAVGAAAMAGSIVGALKNRGDGFGTGGAGSYDPKQSGKDNIPRPHSTGDIQSGGSGSGGSDGVSDSKKDGGYSSETAHGQTPYAGKPENEKSGGDSTNKYEKRAKEGRDKREGKSGSSESGGTGKGVNPELSNNSKPSASDKAKTYAQRSRDQRAYADSVGSEANMGERIAGVRSRVASKVNSAKSKAYDTRARAGEQATKMKQGVSDGVANAKAKAKSGMNNASSRVKNSRAVSAYNNAKSSVSQSVNRNVSSYKSGVNKANSRTQAKVNSYKKPRNKSKKK